MVAALALGIPAIAACRPDSTSTATSATYGATLTGTREVPSVVTTSRGDATLTLTGKTVVYAVTASGFSSPLTVGHVHIGGSGIVGPVIVPFTVGAQAGTVATGSIDLSVPVTFNNITITGDSLRMLFETGQAYVNLHTAAFPGGEIRGQIVRR